MISADRKERIRSALVSYSKKQFSEQVTNVQLSNESEDALDSSKLVAPVSPTPDELIDMVMPRLNLTADSLVVDLGCGDGRWIIAASKNYNCKCIGCDIDGKRLALAEEGVSKLPYSDKVELLKSDVFAVAWSNVLNDADVIVLYLFREAITKMSKILRNRCKYGSLKKDAVVVSVGFSLPSFVPTWDYEFKGIRVYMYNLEEKANE